MYLRTLLIKARPGTQYCSEIDIVIAGASMRMLRGITVVFKCILASCRIKRRLYGEYGVRNVFVIQEI